MTQRTFTVIPSQLKSKINNLINDGWKILSTHDTSTPYAEDFDGTPYGGEEVTIIAEKEGGLYEKPKVLRSSFNSNIGLPCNPPGPSGR